MLASGPLNSLNIIGVLTATEEDHWSHNIKMHSWRINSFGFSSTSLFNEEKDICFLTPKW